MKRLLLVLVFTTLTSVSAGEEWQTRETLGYRLHYTEADSTEIDAVASVLRDFDRSFAEVVAADPSLFADIRIDVYLYPPGS